MSCSGPTCYSRPTTSGFGEFGPTLKLERRHSMCVRSGRYEKAPTDFRNTSPNVCTIAARRGWADMTTPLPCAMASVSAAVPAMQSTSHLYHPAHRALTCSMSPPALRMPNGSKMDRSTGGLCTARLQARVSNRLAKFMAQIGGGGGIRTHGGLAPTSVFKTDAFVRSATPPSIQSSNLTPPIVSRHGPHHRCAGVAESARRPGDHPLPYRAAPSARCWAW